MTYFIKNLKATCHTEWFVATVFWVVLCQDADVFHYIQHLDVEAN